MMNNNDKNKITPRYLGWREMAISPAVEIAVLALAAFCVHLVNLRVHLSFFAKAVLFYSLVMAWTLLVLKVLRSSFSDTFREGVISKTHDTWSYYLIGLYGFLALTNIVLHYNIALVPYWMRKSFYKLLGLRAGKGLIIIGGKLVDPHLTTLETNCVIGDESLIMCHAYSRVGDDDVWIFGRVTVEEGATVGARSILMPGVSVGRYAVVNAMSFVPMGTQIPPYEIWGGHPAKKVGTTRLNGDKDA